MGAIPTPRAPMWVLQPSTVSMLSVQLQQQKLIPSSEGYLRDWRGVAELSGLAANHHVFQKIKNSSEPFSEIFNNWKKLPEANVSELWDILGKVDRFDVRDDVGQKIKEDVKVAAETAAKKGLDLKNLTAAESASGEEALTMEDLDCLNSGKPLPVYDAFILYGEEDEIVSEIVANLEAQGLKILIKDRDLLGGTFEHAAVMKLISSRCTKLVPLFSPSFFSSEYNTFLANFAQHLSLESPGKITAKIIPIVSDQRCDIPPNLGMYSKLKYDPSNTLFNFWERLVRTINPSVKYNPMNAPNTVPPAQKESQGLKPDKSASTPKNVKSASTPKISSKTVKSKEVPTKQEFSNIAFNGTSSSEPSSLESEVTGDSGALLLPDVPNHEPGLVGWMKSKLPNKKAKKAKTKYKQSGADSSAC
eukprot:TRINITY_DN25575_c0_g1_i1.p1 TRINITY_DN25575_c0_g1~~TRINITY_DN25575_c0_g1_i1.p1  ORF type:complete len:418 (-),score=134.47 TRINITY_DN25575_c0_g1_i1:123-1376(-)